MPRPFPSTPPHSPRDNQSQEPDSGNANSPDVRSGLINGRDSTLTLATQNLWATSPEVGQLQERRDGTLGNLQRIAARGTQLLEDTMDETRDHEHQRREMAIGQKEQHRFILNHTLQALADNLSYNLNVSRALGRTGENIDGLVTRHHGQNSMIVASASNGLSEVANTYNQQYDFMAAARADRAADLSLVCDLLERNMRIETQALQVASDQIRGEYELKFRQIRLAIEFVQRVQVEMRANSEMLEREKDNASRRRIQESQEQAARDKAMIELNMSQDEARRASRLLSQKESQAHRVKMEELSLQRGRDNMDHERRVKRYFSLWGFLFG